jgi:hypothetical protein
MAWPSGTFFSSFGLCFIAVLGESPVKGFISGAIELLFIFGGHFDR